MLTITAPKERNEAIEKVLEVLRDTLRMDDGLNVVTMSLVNPSPANDAMATIRRGDRKVAVLYIDYKANVTPGRVRQYIERMKGSALSSEDVYEVSMLAGPYIQPESRALLRDAGFGYIDMAGNCCIKTPLLLVLTKNDDVKVNSDNPPPNLFLRSAEKTRIILRKMLELPLMSNTVTGFATDVGISAGMASKILKELERSGYVHRERSGVRLVKPVTLIRDWAVEYHKYSTSRKEYYSRQSLPDIETGIAKWCSENPDSQYALTGFSGANRYQPVVRSPRVHLYFLGRLDDMAKDLGWSSVETGGNIFVLASPDTQTIQDADTLQGFRIVQPAQLCLDLLGMKDRGEEAAEAILLKEYQPYER